MFNMKLLLIFCLEMVFVQGYKIFYMDDSCKHAAQPVMDIYVESSGLNSTGILRAAHYSPYTRGVITKLKNLNATGIQKTERYPITHTSGMNCSVNLIPPKGYGVILSIRFINFRNSYCTDYLKFTTGSTSFTECGPYVDDETESRSYTFAETVMITFNTEYRYYSDIASGFQLTFTVFNRSVSGTCFGTDAFACSNHNCIWGELICDGHNNCGDLSDENPFGEANCGYRGSTIHYFGVFVSLFILVLITTATCYYCCHRHRTLVYSGVIVRSPLTTASGPMNYGTCGITAYSGQQLVTPGMMESSGPGYPLPPNHTALRPPFASSDSTGLTPGLGPSHSDPYPPPDMSGRPPSPPPPYTQKPASK